MIDVADRFAVFAARSAFRLGEAKRTGLAIPNFARGGQQMRRHRGNAPYSYFVAAQFCAIAFGQETNLPIAPNRAEQYSLERTFFELPRAVERLRRRRAKNEFCYHRIARRTLRR
ncbi:hypothetical protein RAD16_16875 [Bradyrhizobium sp. 18BD]